MIFNPWISLDSDTAEAGRLRDVPLSKLNNALSFHISSTKILLSATSGSPKPKSHPVHRLGRQEKEKKNTQSLTSSTIGSTGLTTLKASPFSSKCSILRVWNPPTRVGSLAISTFVFQNRPFSSLNNSIYPQYMLNPRATLAISASLRLVQGTPDSENCIRFGVARCAAR